MTAHDYIIIDQKRYTYQPFGQSRKISTYKVMVVVINLIHRKSLLFRRFIKRYRDLSVTDDTSH